MALNNYPVRSADRFIVCDPPTFSNSKKMKGTFSIDKDYVELIQRCAKLLSPNGVLIFSTNSRAFTLDEHLLPQELTITNISKKNHSLRF